MAIKGSKRDKRRKYGIILFCYLAVCVFTLTTGFIDARRTVEEYNSSQAKLVSGLLVENVNVALNNAVAQVEQVSYAVVSGMRDNSSHIYNVLQEYASRSDVDSIGFLNARLKVYGQLGDRRDLIKSGYLKQAAGARETMVTDPHRSRISASMVITILVPVYEAGQWLGTVYANFPLDKLQEYADMDNLNGQADIYLINCRSLNSIACTDSEHVSAGAWNNLALRQSVMEFKGVQAYQFYIAKMQNGVRGDTIQYRIGDIDYTQGYERIDKMENWYLAVELADNITSGSFQIFREKLMGYAMLLVLATVAVCIILIVMEIAQKKNFEKLSSTDTMTGLYNKKTFTALVEEELSDGKTPGVLIFVDVDDFKKYNDTYGHLNGDIVLKKFARELQDTFGERGIVGRYGGDEFIVFVKNVYDQTFVNRSMEHLQQQLSSIELEEFGEVALGFSCGGARYPQDGGSFTELCRLADDALYRVKKDGKGTYYWYQ